MAANIPEQNMLDLARGRKIRASEMEVDKSLVEQMADQTGYALITIAIISGETTDRSIEGDFELTKVEKSNIAEIT